LYKSHANCNHPDDFLALKQLYFSTNGDNWFNSTNWDEVNDFSGPQANTDLSLMYGVSCDANGRVDQVILFNNNLTGNLTQNIGYLGEVVSFNLSNNSISGSLPTEIGDLSKVQNLNLRNNNFSGDIPNEIAYNSYLQYLDLSYNNFTGDIPASLSTLLNLKELKLNINELTGGLVPEFFTMQNLKKLFLSDNNIAGNFPAFEIDSLSVSNLESILLQNNVISGNITNDIEQLGQLKFLNLNSNNIIGTLPDGICNLSNLENIQLFDNNLTGKLPACLAELGNLYAVMLANNNFEGCIPYQYDNLCTNNVSVNIANNPNLYNSNYFSFCSNQIGTCYFGDECSDPYIFDSLPNILTNQSTCLLYDDYHFDNVSCIPTNNLLEGKEGIYLLKYEDNQCVDIEVTTNNNNFSMLLSHNCPGDMSTPDCNKAINLQNSNGYTFENFYLPKDSLNYLTIAGMNNYYGDCINYDLNIAKTTQTVINAWVGVSLATWFADVVNWELSSFPGDCEHVDILSGNSLSVLPNDKIRIASLNIELGAELSIDAGADFSVEPK